jgi:hypothetical protein
MSTGRFPAVEWDSEWLALVVVKFLAATGGAA